MVDKAITLEYLGGTYGGYKKPTNFICQLLKMLQLQPDKEIVYTFIQNEDYKYATALGLFYLRLMGNPEEIYQCLEGYYADFRKLRIRGDDGKYQIWYMDEYVDKLLRDEIIFDIVLPRIPKREILESSGQLEKRVSALEENLDEEMGEFNKQLELEEQKLEEQKQKELWADFDKEQEEHQLKEEEELKNKKRDKQGSSDSEESNHRRYKYKHRSKKHHRKSHSRNRSSSSSSSRKKHKKQGKSWRSVINKKHKKRDDHRQDSHKDKSGKEQPKQDDKNQKFEEGSIEYWNNIRASMGMKLLPQN